MEVLLDFVILLLLDPLANSNSLLFETQNYFPWICSSVIYYISYFELPLFPWEIETAGFKCIFCLNTQVWRWHSVYAWLPAAYVLEDLLALHLTSTYCNNYHCQYYQSGHQPHDLLCVGYGKCKLANFLGHVIYVMIHFSANCAAQGGIITCSLFLFNIKLYTTECGTLTSMTEQQKSSEKNDTRLNPGGGEHL